jgi:hypothetical protein
LRGADAQPGVQMPFGPLQTRPEVELPQALSAEGPAQPQRPVSGRHWGLTPAQSPALVGVHSVQAPARGPVCWQAGRFGSGQLGAPSAVQGVQLCVVALQFGVTPPQSASLRHPAQTPTPEAVLHSGCEIGQCAVLVAVQGAQAPLGRHSGVAAGHSASAAQGRQVALAPSQIGWMTAQAATFPGAHCAQAPAAVHTGS